MHPPVLPSDELGRLTALQRYHLLDTLAEPEFDDITSLAADICETPIALISLVDANRQWFKSCVGLGTSETSREVSFCGHAILSDGIFSIPDALLDPRFHDNPLVTGAPHVRFYAGAPLVTSDGFRLGTLCVIDHVPRILSPRQHRAMLSLSRQVVRQFEARQQARSLARTLRFQTAVLNSPDLAMISTSVDGVIAGFNQAAEQMLGYAAQEVLNERSLEFCYATAELAGRLPATDDAPPAFAQLVALADGAPVGSGEWDYQHRDGTRVPVQISITPILDEDATVIGYLSTARSISDRRKAEKALRQALDFITKIAGRVPGMIYQFRRQADGASCFPYASEGMRTVYQLAPAQMEHDAAPMLAMTHPQDQDDMLASIDASARTLTPWRHAYRVRYNDGTIRWLFGNAIPEREENGATLWHGFITDITDQKAAAIELQSNRQFLQTLIDHLPVGITTKRMQSEDIAANGLFRVWNHAAERMTGLCASDVVGRRNIEIQGPIAALVHAAHDEILLTTKLPVTIPVYPFRLPDGSQRLMRVTSLPLFDASGNVEYSLGISEDVTELLEREKELRQRKAELEGVNDASPLGLFRTDAAGACTYVNRTFEAMSGLAGDAALQLGWRAAVHPDDIDTVSRHWSDAIATQSRYNKAHRFLHGDGRIVMVRLMATPVLVDGKVTGYVGTTDDITERSAARQALIDSERRLRMITNNVPAMIGYVDLEQRLRFCNIHYNTLFGFDTTAIIGQTLCEIFGTATYQDMEPHIVNALAGQPASFERVAMARGTQVSQQVEYVPDIDEGGAVRGFYALVTDITARRAAEQRLADSEYRLRTITDNLPVAITYIDHDERFRFANATMLAWIGKRADQIQGQLLLDVVGPELYAERSDFYRRVLHGERVEFVQRSHFFHQNRFLQVTFIPDLGVDGSVRGFFTLSSDITAMKTGEEELRRLARFDSLTGLANRAYLHEVLKAAIGRSKRSGLALAVLFLDVDHFKTINDQFGHLNGDLVLEEFARRLIASVRSTDTVGRLGGDEFVIILEALKTSGDAEIFARKILAEIRKPWNLNGNLLPVTTSIGIAFDAVHLQDGSALISVADAALYEAKAKGRDTFATHVCA